MGKTTVEKARASRRKHYQNNKEVYIKRAKAQRKLLKNYADSQKTKCAICEENEKACLDFHHVRDKEDVIANLVKCGSLKKLKEELSKCIVLCANCHRKVHSGKLTYGCGEIGIISVSKTAVEGS